MTPRHPMPTRQPDIRNKDFCEVALGYDEETAVAEAKRCLNCKTHPCTEGCPVTVNIPSFISRLAEGKTGEAYAVIREASSLPAVCGRVCPQERQCEARCTLGRRGEPVAIGALERFAADRAEEQPAPVPSNGKRVAVVGSGPAGLACAGDLVRLGYEVTVFEALHVVGGVLVYGIPEFRLPKEIVRREADRLRSLGVRFVTNAVAGRAFTAEELLGRGYDAVFLGTGAGLPRFARIKGENALGVFSANEYLTRINLMGAYREDAETPVYRGDRVIVVGGGNVAMDAARCAKRLGAKQVVIVYRRSREELPARKEEALHAEEEGIEFRFLTNPTEILTEKGCVVGVRCAGMALGEPGPDGRRRPVDTGMRTDIGADVVIMALGTSPNPLVKRAAAVALRSGGEIEADEDGRTSVPGIYAGGDAVTGAATVILAMGAGKRAARAIDADLTGKA